MSRGWWLGAALLAAAAAAALAWPRLPEPDAPQTPRHDTTGTAAPAEAEPAHEPRQAAPAAGALRGRIVTTNGTPIASATVTIVGAAASATTERDGTFGLPLQAVGRVTLQASAPGHATVQRGDVATIASETVDVGDLALPPATGYRGRVRSLGHGIAGAEITVRPELTGNAPTTALVRRVRSDADGFFRCEDAPPPPVLVSATAAGHRREPARRVERATDELLFDLQPLPNVRGRVVDGATHAVLPEAHVLLMGFGQEPPPGLTLPPTFSPTPATAVAADGTFTREVTTDHYALAAMANGHVARLIGSRPTRDGDTHTIVLDPGATVVCTAAWTTAGLGGLAMLFADEAAGTRPFAQTEIATGEPTPLPTVPCGRWLLRLQFEGPALFEQWLDLRTPTEHRVDAPLSAGARLVGNYRGVLASGRSVVCVHRDGRTLRGLVLTDGSFTVTGLHPGPWAVAVHDRYGDARMHRATEQLLASRAVQIEVPPGRDEVHLDVQPAERHFGTVRIAAPGVPAGTTFDLEPVDARTSPLPPASSTATLDAEGHASIGPVPPGTWRVRDSRHSAAVYRARPPILVEVVAGATTDVHIPE